VCTRAQEREGTGGKGRKKHSRKVSEKFCMGWGKGVRSSIGVRSGKLGSARC